MTFDSISSPAPMSTFNTGPRNAEVAQDHLCNNTSSTGFSRHAAASAVAAPVQLEGHGQHRHQQPQQEHQARPLLLNFQHLKSHHRHHHGHFNQQHQHSHVNSNNDSHDSLCQSPLASPGILSLEQLLNSSHLSTAPASTTSSAPQSPETPQLHSFAHQQNHPSSSTMLSSLIDSVGPQHCDLSAWIASTTHARAAMCGMVLGDHGASSSASAANADVLDHFMHFSAAYPEVHVNGLGLVDESLVCLASPIVDHHQDQGLSSPLIAMNASSSSPLGGAGTGDVHGGFAGSHHGVIPGHLHWHQVNGDTSTSSSGSAPAAAADLACAHSLPSPVPSTRSSTGPADQHQASAAKANNTRALGYKGSPPPADLWSLPLKSSLDLDVFSHGSVMSSAPTSPSMRLMTFAVDPEVIKQALMSQIGASSGSDSAAGPSPLSAATSASPTMPAPSREGGSACMDLQALFGGNAAHAGEPVAADVAMDDSPPSPPATPLVVNPKQAHEDSQVARQHHQVQYQAPRYPNQAPMPMLVAARPSLPVSSVQANSDLTSPVLPSPMTAAFLLAQQTPLPPTPTTPSVPFDGYAASATSGAAAGSMSSSNMVSYPETLPAPTKLCPAPVRRPRMRKRSTLSGDDGMGGSPPVGVHHPYAQHGMVATTSNAASSAFHPAPSSPVTPTIPEHPLSPSATATAFSALLASSGTDDSGTSKMYTCIKCDKSFKRKADCVRHARVHTGEKPYRCPCGESFARQDALRRHQSKAPLETACRMALLNGGVLPSVFSGDDGVHLSPGLTVVGGRPVSSLDRSPAALACVVALAPAPARE